MRLTGDVLAGRGRAPGRAHQRGARRAQRRAGGAQTRERRGRRHHAVRRAGRAVGKLAAGRAAARCARRRGRVRRRLAPPRSRRDLAARARRRADRARAHQPLRTPPRRRRLLRRRSPKDHPHPRAGGEVYAWFPTGKSPTLHVARALADHRLERRARTGWSTGSPAPPSNGTPRPTSCRPRRRLAWRSLPGGDVDHEGQVDFEPAEEGGTRLHVRLSYHPPIGRIGHAIASLFKKDPKHALDDDLLRFKSLIEEGKATAHGAQVRRGELHEPKPW